MCMNAQSEAEATTGSFPPRSYSTNDISTQNWIFRYKYRWRTPSVIKLNREEGRRARVASFAMTVSARSLSRRSAVSYLSIVRRELLHEEPWLWWWWVNRGLVCFVTCMWCFSPRVLDSRNSRQANDKSIIYGGLRPCVEHLEYRSA